MVVGCLRLISALKGGVACCIQRGVRSPQHGPPTKRTPPLYRRNSAPRHVSPAEQHPSTNNTPPLPRPQYECSAATIAALPRRIGLPVLLHHPYRARRRYPSCAHAVRSQSDRVSASGGPADCAVQLPACEENRRAVHPED